MQASMRGTRLTLLIIVGVQVLPAQAIGRVAVDLGSVVSKDVVPFDVPIVIGVKPPAGVTDRKSTRLNSSHSRRSRMPSSA